MRMPEPTDRFIYLLGMLFDRYRERVYARLADAGHSAVRPAHSAIFRGIHVDGSRMVDLAARAGITKQSIAYLVADLEKSGYLTVGPDPHDRRARLVMLSDKGLEVHHLLPTISRAVETEAAQELGLADLEDTKDLLRRLLERTSR